MKLKTKLLIGLGFLFVLTVIVGGMGAYYLLKLAHDSQAVIKDNYKSVTYTKEMIAALEGMGIFQTAKFNHARKDIGENIFKSPQFRRLRTTFEENLALQEKNITEEGELELTQQLRHNYHEYIKLLEKAARENIYTSDYYLENIYPLYDQINSQVFGILDANMQAIIRKNERLQTTAHNVTNYLIMIGLVCAIVSFVFILNFPNYLLKPIQALTQGIMEISNQNYKQQLDFQSNDEFGELAVSFNNMANKLNEYENSRLAKLLFEKKRNEAIINTMQDGMIGLDENKVILFANPTATKLLCLQEDELVGKYAPDVATYNDLLRHLIQVLMTDKVPDNEHKIKIFTENQEQHFTKEILDISRENGSPIGKVIILKNVTNFYQEAEAKSNFMAAISHELKTPISSINMSIKLLENKRVGNLNKEQKELISLMKDDSQRLLKITSELLDLAKLESGNIQMIYQDIAPQQIIDLAKEALQVQAEQKHLHFEVKIEDSVPLVYADLDKTIWIMRNLLSNAVRYAPENSSIIIAAQSQENNVAFSVQDFGRGIESKYKEKVFERFFQIPDEEGKSGGTGLGLAIVKEFAQLQGGNVSLESEIGQGSTFTFTLPKKV